MSGGGGDENIQLLMQRLAVATVPQQKVDIVVLLKGMSAQPHHRMELGRVALPQLLDTLCRESSQEVVTEVLELLSKLVAVEGGGGTRPAAATQGRGAGGVAGAGGLSDQTPYINTEFLLQNPVAVDKLLSLLQEKDKLWLRLNAVRLLRTLADNRPEMVGASVLDVEAGMMRLVDVLKDQREEVRNELLLLLVGLTRRSEQVQNFCAFNDVWGSLLAIMEEEAMAGAIVHDCLQTIGNTLEGNNLTCKLFVSDRCCREVARFLDTASLLEEVPAAAQHSEQLLERSRCNHALRIMSSLVAGVRNACMHAAVFCPLFRRRRTARCTWPGGLIAPVVAHTHATRARAWTCVRAWPWVSHCCVCSDRFAKY
jgi:hypothetical protein